MFTAGSSIKESNPNGFRRTLMANIMNHSGLHAYNLLGRNAQSYYCKGADKKLMTIGKHQAEKKLSNGMYVIP
jgi:hypothetical protein